MQLQGWVTSLDLSKLAIVLPDGGLAKTVELLGGLCGDLLTLGVLKVGPRKFDRLQQRRFG